jgi:hypothetical protein
MVVATLQSVFERDAYETTRPMNTYNESPAELRALFDFVAYDKCKFEASKKPTESLNVECPLESEVISCQMQYLFHYVSKIS